VQVKDRQRHYLMFEVMGGERNNTGFENLLKGAGILPNGWYAIPASGAPLNSYGNVQGGLFNKMLSQLQASRDPLTNEPGAGVWGARAKRNRKPLGRYFAVKDGDTTHLRPGIYERTSLSKYAAIRPIFTFTPKRPKYRARFDFYGKGEALARQIFPVKFDAAVRRAIASAR
jgi:hypothetical protein